MDRRVKLVFADELGRFLLRKRGFSSCWFLVPPNAKLVGDLAHEIRHEFGLSVARCPSGVDLVLEQLHLLPSHDIRIVRDNDEICVQCSAVGSSGYASRQRSDELVLLEASSDDEEQQQQQQEKPKKRRDKKQKKTTVAIADTSPTDEKKARKELKKAKREDKKRMVAAAKARSPGDESSSSSDSEEKKKKQPVAATPKSKKRKAIAPPAPAPVESSSSSSSSSSDSSDSGGSSSSSDSEDESAEKTRQPERKRQRAEGSKPSATSKLPLKPVPGKKAPGNANGVGEPRQRRRRRPRNRKPREERAKRPQENGAAALVIQSAALPVPGHRSANPLAMLPSPVIALPQPDASVPETTDPKTSSVAKGHVRFGDAGESQVVAKSTVSKSSSGDTLNIRKPRAYVFPELKKYGPSKTPTSREPQQQQQQQQQHHANGHQRHQPEASSAPPLQDAESTTTAKTKKKQWGDMWKRPYEIVATIHDQPDSQSDAARSSVDIPRLLAKFPPPFSDASATWFQTGDIIAYKTLTLCMETWQPIASEWICGKVLSVSSGSSSDSGASEVEVQPMALSVCSDGESEKLQWTPTGDSAESEASIAVQASEVSEIRYLEGPSFQTRPGQPPW